jgi:uncharacterized membrane protein
VISNLLRTGVLISFLLVVVGTLLSFVHHPGYTTSTAELQRLTRPGAAFPHRFPEVAQGLRAGRGQAVIAVGLLVLIATPVLRVAVSILAFWQEGDRKFVLITSVVLALLLASFFLGKAGG